ncbi:uncharacterized protein LAESUDRAFT_695158 [Laetiporus sulphureus 93-53]|uniref:Protein PNS1 n=1 Tax=Laetiporus sulphureus 93-53 TaxID=1314785 RepID=A0A165FXL7_9APHY|nr:uncharacterized protein LAESUDRAFT_695158 [Laetiporus sulphureus 93-53]KZT09551.1 hypothetical protein LAESUDRAFT_695158 [Laetiporus sulphureus 93-53]
MASSFATYASQYLNRRQAGTSSLTSSQPLFYSFSSEDDSRQGSPVEADLDDLDDPHLDTSVASRGTVRREGTHTLGHEEDDDPYLRLDEEDLNVSHHQSYSIPLLGASDREDAKGWLAHASPLRSPSPSPSSSSVDSGRPPSDILSASSRPLPHVEPPESPLIPPPPRAEITLSLTESLLPRDGLTRPLDVFSLPDLRYIPRGRRKYNDFVWTALWCASVSICIFFSILILFLTRRPTKHPQVPLPYVTLLHTIPLLTILTFLSALVAYLHVFLLRIFVKPVMIVTSVFIPATLFISAIWAFVGSFMWEAGTEPTWGETVGLRLFSLVPLVLSLLTARKLLDLPRDIHTASSLLTLTTRLLMMNPFLLALSPVVLLAALLASIPFITLAFRLLLIGYFGHPHGSNSGWEWYVRGWANWAIAGTIGVWLWSWGVARGVLRVTCAGVIGAWYFADPALPPPPPTNTHTIHAAITRATQPSLGTVVLSALIIAVIRFLGLLVAGLRALPYYLPPYMRLVSVAAGFAVGYMENVTGSLSKYALVYTGLTGDAFFPSARRSRTLTAEVEKSSVVDYRRRFKTEPSLTILTFAPLTLTFPFALGTYLFVAHTLNAPDSALSAALLAGTITALVGLFCIGLVRDTADTLYLCYCIDRGVGERHRDEVFEAFEYQSRRQQPTQASRPPPSAQEPQRFRQPDLLVTPPAAPPPPRAETPDPFEQSPDLEAQSYPGPSSPSTSALTSKSRMPLSRRESVLPEPMLSTTLPLHEESDEDEDGEGEESQLFPGSDLF